MRIASTCPLPVGARAIGRLARLGVSASFLAMGLGCDHQSPVTPLGSDPPPEVVPVYGSVLVRVVTSGENLDADGFVVEVNGPWAYDHAPTRVATNGTVTLTYLTPGSHVLALLDVATNCVGENIDALPVIVAPNAVTAVSFQLVCTRTGVSE